MTGLNGLLTRASTLLFDFDGPICSVFRAHPPTQVTAELARVVENSGGTVGDEQRALGPHDFLAWVDRTHPGTTAATEQRLAHVEEQAVTAAEPTPYAFDVLQAAAAAGLQLAIVSNNAATAIEHYLKQHDVTGIGAIVGRPAQPTRMKPNPWSVTEATRQLGVEPESCILVGDSESDITAARAAGTGVVGYATTSDDSAELAAEGAELVLESLRPLVVAVHELRAR